VAKAASAARPSGCKLPARSWSSINSAARYACRCLSRVAVVRMGCCISLLYGTLLGWRCPRGPGEAACFGELAGDLSGDQAADRVGVCARQFWISPALDFGPQGVAGPAAASAVVITSGSTPSASRCTTSLVTS
jgi:hypothetical protein